MRENIASSMTLNLMLTSRDAVYLSGDFRLVSIEDRLALRDSYDTQKLIPVIRHGWAALVAYMGIASAPPLIPDMGQWIVEQLDGVPSGADFPELSTRLLRLNRWLERIRGDRRIAFSVVGFRHRRPFMMLLSNFLDLDGHVTAAGPQLSAYVRTPVKPEVRAAATKARTRASWRFSTSTSAALRTKEAGEPGPGNRTGRSERIRAFINGASSIMSIGTTCSRW